MADELRRANPAIGVTVDPDAIAEELRAGEVEQESEGKGA